jgi:hypothetical protein
MFLFFPIECKYFGFLILLSHKKIGLQDNRLSVPFFKSLELVGTKCKIILSCF